MGALCQRLSEMLTKSAPTCDFMDKYGKYHDKSEDEEFLF